MYKIIRMYQDSNKASHTVRHRLTLEQAQDHCRDPETSSRTCTNYTGKHRTRLYGPWFDGYEET